MMLYGNAKSYSSKNLLSNLGGIMTFGIILATIVAVLVVLAVWADLGSRRAAMLLITIFISVLMPIAVIRLLTAIVQNPDKAWDIIKAFDRVGNALTNGDWNQMISTRANIAKTEGKAWGCYLCYLLDKIQPNHCENSVG